MSHIAREHSLRLPAPDSRTVLPAETPHPSVRRIGRCLLGIFGLLLLGHLFRFYYFHFTSHPFAYRLVDKLSLTTELTLPAWFSSTLLLGCGVLCGLIYHRFRQTAQASIWQWALVGSLLVLMSIDESISVHETLGEMLSDRVHATGVFRYAWVLIALPILVVACVVLLPWVLGLPRPLPLCLLVAAAVYFGGAVGTEMLGGLAFDTVGRDSWQYFLTATIEESMEIVGVILAFLALLSYLQSLPPNPA